MARRARSLWPKEHGAYAQLLVPLLTSFLLWSPTAPGLAWAVAATCVFIAHEAGLVLLGRRGPRARDEAGARARRWAGGLGALAAVAVAGAVFLQPALLLALGPVLATSLGAGVLVALDKERTLLGEIVAAVALSGVGFPVARAAGVALEPALAVWGAWAVGYAAATAGVRGVIAAAKGRPAPFVWPVVLTAGLAAAGAPFAPLRSLGEVVAAGAAPLVICGAVLLVTKPAPRHLRRVGFGLVGASLVSAGLLLAVL